MPRQIFEVLPSIGFRQGLPSMQQRCWKLSHSRILLACRNAVHPRSECRQACGVFFIGWWLYFWATDVQTAHNKGLKYGKYRQSFAQIAMRSKRGSTGRSFPGPGSDIGLIEKFTKRATDRWLADLFLRSRKSRIVNGPPFLPRGSESPPFCVCLFDWKKSETLASDTVVAAAARRF